jgi:hypothetical protein
MHYLWVHCFTQILDVLPKRCVSKVILHKEVVVRDKQQQQLEFEKYKRECEVQGFDAVTKEPLVDMVIIISLGLYFLFLFVSCSLTRRW